MAHLAKAFEGDVTKRFFSLPIRDDWVHRDDLLDLFNSDITRSTVDSLCGKHLTQRHPRFIESLWKLDDGVRKSLLRFPRFLAQDTYAVRDAAILAIKDWHSWATGNFDPVYIDEDGDDPFWGSQFFRDRQKMFQDMDGFNGDAIASQDLAFLWVFVHTRSLRLPGLLTADGKCTQQCDSDRVLGYSRSLQRLDLARTHPHRSAILSHSQRNGPWKRATDV
jgi:hypothetical protein